MLTVEKVDVRGFPYGGDGAKVFTFWDAGSVRGSDDGGDDASERLCCEALVALKKGLGRGRRRRVS